MRLTKTNLIIFLLVALIFLLVQAKGLKHIAPGDENVYFYMAKQISEGQIPYRDFFYAHPPLHILILSVIIKIFGVNFIALKSATLLSLLIASFFLYKTSLELFKNRLNDTNAELISALALILFLFTFEVMFKAVFSMGINFSLMFLMISFYLIFTRRYFIGGLFAGFAGITRFYALIPILAVFAFNFIKAIQDEKGRNFILLFGGFLASFGTTILVLTVIFGQSFIEPVFTYHILKPEISKQRYVVYKNILKENWVIFTSFLLSFLIKNKKRFQLFYLITFVYAIFFLSLKVPAEFYFSIAYPFMAILGAYSIVDLIRGIKASSNALKYAKYFFVFSLGLALLWNVIVDITFLNKVGFLEFKDMSNIAKKVSSTAQNQEVFGDPSIVPLIALMSNRGIALNYIDSNEMRLTSGLTNFYLLTNQLDDVNLSYIILRENKGLDQIVEFKQYVKSRCKLDTKYFDIAEGTFLVYKC